MLSTSSLLCNEGFLKSVSIIKTFLKFVRCSSLKIMEHRDLPSSGIVLVIFMILISSSDCENLIEVYIFLNVSSKINFIFLSNSFLSISNKSFIVIKFLFYSLSFAFSQLYLL